MVLEVMKSGTSKEDLYIEYLTRLSEKMSAIMQLVKQSKYELETLIKTLHKYR